MEINNLVVVPNPGIYGFGKVSVSPNGFYKWAFNFWSITVAWLR